MVGAPRIANESVVQGNISHLPLHAKIVPRLNLTKALLMLDADTRSKVEMLWMQLTSPAILQHATEQRILDAEISEEDLQILLEKNFVEEQPHPPKGFIRVKTIAEKLDENCITNIPSTFQDALLAWNSKQHDDALPYTRRRLLAIPDIHNDIFPDVYPAEMCSITESKQDMMELQGSATLDFSAWYTHFELPYDSRQYFCFRFRGRFYRITTAPTGARGLVFIANSITRAIAMESVSRCTITPVARWFLDNIKFSGCETSVTEAVSHALAIATDLNTKLCVETPFATKYRWLGIIYDHTSKSTTPLPKCKLKLLNAYQAILRQNSTVADGLALLGVVVWITISGGLSLLPHYYIVKFFRRRCSRPINAPLDLWPSIGRELMSLMHYAFALPPRHLPNTGAFDMVLFTDACPVGFGGLLFDVLGTSPIRCYYGHWPIAETFTQIDELEIAATYLCVKELPYADEAMATGKRTSILIMIDNTSILSTLQGQHLHAKYQVNRTAMEILRICEEKGYSPPTIKYIKSEQNLADPFSRIKP